MDGPVDRVAPEHVIARLAPSLSPYQHCDIVDFSPGVGLWSAALHEHLKPRRHVLVEDDDVFVPFLQPLLDKPGSRFQLARYPNFTNDTLDRIVQDRLSHGAEPTDVGPRSTNDRALLLVANLGQSQPKRWRGFPSISNLHLYQMIVEAHKHPTFSRYGRVRMLVWTAHGDYRMILPKCVVDRRKSTLEVEACVENIFEIASAVRKNVMERGHEIDLQSAVEVTRDMIQRGVETPECRKGQLQLEAEAVIAGQTVGSSSSPKGEGRDWERELATLARRFQQGQFAKFAEGDSAKKQDGSKTDRRRGVRRNYTPEYYRLASLRYHARRHKKLMDLARSGDHGRREDTHDGVSSEDMQNPSALAADSTIGATKPLTTSLRQLLEKKKYLDDQKALKNRPPLLLWDRRPNEPLLVRADEFYPKTALSLLEIHPKPLAPELAKHPHSWELYEYITQTLFRQPRQPMAEVIESLALGAAEALIPNVPALRDPAKGGEPDLAKLRVRVVTHEMIVGMLKAWEAWRDHPPREDLLLRMGDMGDDDDFYHDEDW